MKYRSNIVTFLAFLLTVLYQNVSDATVGRSLSIDELTEEADVVICGRVEDIRFEVTNDRSMVFTLIEVLVEENLKGNESTGNKVTIKQLGGVDGNEVTVVLGAPFYTPNEEILVFLKEGEGSHFKDNKRVVGMSQGKFTIEIDPSTNEKIASRILDGLHLEGSIDPSIINNKIALDELMDRVRSRK